MADKEKDNFDLTKPEDFDTIYDKLGRGGFEWLGILGASDEMKKQKNELSVSFLTDMRSGRTAFPDTHVSAMYLSVLTGTLNGDVLKDPAGFEKLKTDMEKIKQTHKKIKEAEGTPKNKKTRIDQLTTQANNMMDNFLKGEFDIKPPARIIK